jgi:hypothetical protein
VVGRIRVVDWLSCLGDYAMRCSGAEYAHILAISRQPASRRDLFDQFVRAQRERLRDRQAERPGGLDYTCAPRSFGL